MSELRYSRQQISEADIKAVVRVLRSDWLTQGPEVEAFEAELAEYVGAKYCVAVSSGTAALHLALKLSGRYGWDVLTSPLTFVATANAAQYADYNVGFGDVHPATGNLAVATTRTGWQHDPDELRSRGLEPQQAKLPHISVPVHYAGRACDLRIFSGTIIEDACHALGAMDFDGCSRIGSCAHSLATVFSFHPVKPITTGEGGAITTNDQGLADAARVMRSHGRIEGRMETLGWNYRMTDIQAALGRSQLKRCDEMRERRERLAKLYGSAWMNHVSETDRRPKWFAPAKPLEAGSWHLFPIRIKDGKRDAVKAALNEQGIMAQIHYPSVHLEPYYRKRFGYKPGDFPEAEAWSAEELSLPLHAGMTEQDVTRVVDALRKELAA